MILSMKSPLLESPLPLNTKRIYIHTIIYTKSYITFKELIIEERGWKWINYNFGGVGGVECIYSFILEYQLIIIFYDICQLLFTIKKNQLKSR